MPAKFIQIAESRHDHERRALRLLVDGLPSTFTVYGNPWLVERTGVIHELDAVVSAPHGIFVVEIKSYRGRIEGTDTNWYIPETITSPIKLNRITAQVLKNQLKDHDSAAGRSWVEGFIFLSETLNCGVRGPASNDRIYTKDKILLALQDTELLKRLSRGMSTPVNPATDRALLAIFQANQNGPLRPVRSVREYDVVRKVSVEETFSELLGKNRITGEERLLRIYSLPPLASEEQVQRVKERASWEAQVLRRIGRIEGVLTADAPFTDEAGIVLPLESFKGITLASWLERYGVDTRGRSKADLTTRVSLWLKFAQAIADAHREGVVHRLLRPEVLLVEDAEKPTVVRVTGFDLAKQQNVDTAIRLTSIADERLVFSAPEVVQAFSTAEPASDQFSLGALLALTLTGKPLFESTRQYLNTRRFLRRVRDIAPNVPLSLDEAVTQMLALSPSDRFPSLEQAIEAVRFGAAPQNRALPNVAVTPKQALDVDNLSPGARLGADYEVVSRLGQGGLSVVYAARHLVSGRTRALKIASSTDAAEQALRDEYNALSDLDHPNIVRVIDLSKMVEGRLTLVMERVGETTLRQWLQANQRPSGPMQRQLAENLLAGLEHLESRGITHKDLKPDNLLVHDGRLTIIDFSLAGMKEDAAFGGTALYRDPTSLRWTHGTDRYAAALCLFELYAGRHAFDGRVPEPRVMPSVREEDIDPPGLAEFFRKALNPTPELRFTSARTMRDGLLRALGAEPEHEGTPAPVAATLDEKTPLRLSGLSNRAVNALARCQALTIGQMLALPPAQVRALHAIGTKTADEIITLQESLLAKGLKPSSTSALTVEPPLVPELTSSLEPLHKLPLDGTIRAHLERSHLSTIGQVASLTQSQLLALDGVSRPRFAKVVEALSTFRDRSQGAADRAHTLDGLWDLASRPLKDEQKEAIELTLGLKGDPKPQGLVADELKRSQPQVSLDMNQGLEVLDLAVLADVQAALEELLDSLGGVARLDELAERLEEAWPAGDVRGAGLVRLLVRVLPGSMHLVDDGLETTLVARPLLDRDTLRAFVAEVNRLANTWPPIEPDSVRRSLEATMPYYRGDVLALGVRLLDDVNLTESGYLFVPPLDAKQTIKFVLDRAREPLTLDKLKEQVTRMFGATTPYPDAAHLGAVLAELECHVQDERVVQGRQASLLAKPQPVPDALPAALLAGRTPEEVTRDMLREAARANGFRLLVTPPETHAELGRSVAKALGTTFVSFEDAFFTEHQADLPQLERASRFVAQREQLQEAARATMKRLIEEHGRPGRVTVLGDTALLGLCESVDLARLPFSEGQGFWVLVVPGVIHNRQPLFNEGKDPVFHLPGQTLPLLKPLPT
ncbi:MAG: protein kinase [Myxococcaceae bacterium]|nr:protein kinase [Myxococcaceae bacterium]